MCIYLMYTMGGVYGVYHLYIMYTGVGGYQIKSLMRSKHAIYNRLLTSPDTRTTSWSNTKIIQAFLTTPGFFYTSIKLSSTSSCSWNFLPLVSLDTPSLLQFLPFLPFQSNIYSTFNKYLFRRWRVYWNINIHGFKQDLFNPNPLIFTIGWVYLQEKLVHLFRTDGVLSPGQVKY